MFYLKGLLGKAWVSSSDFFLSRLYKNGWQAFHYHRQYLDNTAMCVSLTNLIVYFNGSDLNGY